MQKSCPKTLTANENFSTCAQEEKNHKDTKGTKIFNFLCALYVFVVLICGS